MRSRPAALIDRLAEVDLGLAGPVHQRDEDLAALEPQVADGLLDDGVAAPVALVAEPLVDPLGGVPLLPRGLLVVLEDLGDPVEVGAELGLGPGRVGAVAGRLAVPEDLLQRGPVHPGLAEDLAFADAVDQDAASDLSPL